MKTDVPWPALFLESQALTSVHPAILSLISTQGLSPAYLTVDVLPVRELPASFSATPTPMSLLAPSLPWTVTSPGQFSEKQTPQLWPM